MQKSFRYRVAILDWATRRVLAWRLSHTLTADFCAAALQEALTRYGTPEIFNTDQGSQFTSTEFTDVLKAYAIRISRDGRRRCHDHLFVERRWWTVKHEWVSLRPATNGIKQKKSLVECFDWDNCRRPHQSLDWQTPDEGVLRGPCPSRSKGGLTHALWIFGQSAAPIPAFALRPILGTARGKRAAFPTARPQAGGCPQAPQRSISSG